MTLGIPTSAINSVILSLEEKRSDQHFELLWNDINDFARKHNIFLMKNHPRKGILPIMNQYLKNSLVKIGSHKPIVDLRIEKNQCLLSNSQLCN